MFYFGCAIRTLHPNRHFSGDGGKSLKSNQFCPLYIGKFTVFLGFTQIWWDGAKMRRSKIIMIMAQHDIEQHFFPNQNASKLFSSKV